MGPSSSSSSPENSYGSEEYYQSLEITDDSPFDGEVCKRLNQLIPVPVSGAYLNYIDVLYMFYVSVCIPRMLSKFIVELFLCFIGLYTKWQNISPSCNSDAFIHCWCICQSLVGYMYCYGITGLIVSTLKKKLFNIQTQKAEVSS